MPHIPTIVAPHNGEEVHIVPGGFTALCVAIHTLNRQWWLDSKGGLKDRNTGEMLMLQVSEISEAMEADRKNLMDDKLKEMFGLDVEEIDAVIRICDLLGKRYLEKEGTFGVRDSQGNFAFSPGDVLVAKCLYNSQRADHRPEARAEANGKKY